MRQEPKVKSSLIFPILEATTAKTFSSSKQDASQQTCSCFKLPSLLAGRGKKGYDDWNIDLKCQYVCSMTRSASSFTTSHEAIVLPETQFQRKTISEIQASQVSFRLHKRDGNDRML